MIWLFFPNFWKFLGYEKMHSSDSLDDSFFLMFQSVFSDIIAKQHLLKGRNIKSAPVFSGSVLFYN